MIASQLDRFEPLASLWLEWQRMEPVMDGYEWARFRQALLDWDSAPERKDALLSALVRLGQQHSDADAKTAVTVCLLPGLHRLARRYEDLLGTHEVWAELLAGTWAHVDTYDLARRPRGIAANMLWDTHADVLRVVRRERAWRARIALDVHADMFMVEPLFEPNAIESAVADGMLQSLDATLIQATRLDGLRLADAAALLGMSYEAAKKRRRRAEAALAGWWAPYLCRALPAVETLADAPRAA